MINLIRAEWLKLKRNRNLKWIIVGELILVANIILSNYYLIEEGIRSKAQVVGIEGVKEMIASPENSTLFLIIFGGYYIAREFENDVLKTPLSYGYTKEQIVIAKLVVYFLVAIGLNIVPIVLAGTLLTLQYGWGEVINNRQIIYMVRLLGLSLLVTTANASVIAFFAFLYKGLTLTLVVNIVVLTFTSALSFLLDKFYPEIFALIFNNCYFILDKAVNRDASIAHLRGIALSAVITTFIALLGIMKLTKKNDF